MKTTLMILSLCMMLVAVSAATVPQAPYWPSKFAQDFQENIKMNRSNVEILGTY